MAFDALERRRLFAVTASLASGVLSITGDDTPNAITVSRDLAGTILVNGGAVTIAGGPAIVANTTGISIAALAGDDVVKLDETNGLLAKAVISGGDGNDSASGGRGADVVDLGNGDDTFSWNPGDGSDVVDGRSGHDTLDFNGSVTSEMIELSANNDRLVLTRNLGGIVMDVGGTEQVNVNALNGQDTITVHDLGLSDVSLVHVSLENLPGSGTGDGLADAVVVIARDIIDHLQVQGAGAAYAVLGLSAEIDVEGSEGDRDGLLVNGKGGNDTINAASLPANMALLSIDGDSGDDALTGSAGDDTLIGNDGNDKILGKVGSDAALLGDGNDTFQWDPGDGSDLIDGGLGGDRLFFNGADTADLIEISASVGHARVAHDDGTIDLVGTEELLFNALGGADTINVNDLAGTAVTQVNVDLGITGDEAADTLIVNGTDGADAINIFDSQTITSVRGLTAVVSVKHVEATSDRLLVNTLAGADTIRVEQSGLNGTMRLVALNGGADSDAIDIVETMNDGVVTVTPTAGNDAVTVNSDSIGSAIVQFDVASQRLGGLIVRDGGTARVPAGTHGALVVTSLTLGNAGTIDLNDNALIVDYASTSPLATIADRIRIARAGGAWTGAGITSSSARHEAATAAHNTTLGAMEATDFKSINGPAALFAGQAIDATAVLVKYTYHGDADFNGVVNFDDYSRIDNGFSTSKTGWLNGDFDGNGSVNFDDYSLIDNAFNTQGGPLRSDPPIRGGKAGRMR